MKIIRTIKEMQKESRRLVAAGKRIGLVPTMGFLHDGHLSLIARARREADVVVTTIFVNPAQFAPHEDFAKYPRDEKGDIRKIARAGGTIVFIPKANAMYADGFQTYVNVEELSKPLEGTVRPGHFVGVATVVAKLFNITRPDVVVFGQKDFQQATILRRMTLDLDYPIKYIVAPTVRERDGLAMSSRNKYLDSTARREAVALIRALRTAKAMVRSGTVNSRTIQKEMRAVIKGTCPTANIDYIAFTDTATLSASPRVTKGVVCSLAVRVHGVRLIDNMKLL
ncbi:MAG: pantoate--beta-alanine ligase [Candidatus Zixiibacteriota bacterium]